MKVQKVIQTPIGKKLYDCKFKHVSNLLYGNTKEAKKNYQEFAKLAVDNFETAVQVPSPLKGSVPLFSKLGLNIIKYLIYDLFTKNSPEEKQLKKMYEEYKIKKNHLECF